MTAKRQLWILIAAGTAIRLLFGFGAVGSRFDMASYGFVSDALQHSPLEVYSPEARWPYPPAFLPVVVALDQLGQASGVALHALIHVPLIAADAALAWLVHRFLLGRGAEERRALAGAALVALGPSFIVISGYHGQFDAVAVLPAVVAVTLWDSERSDRRAWQAGLLVGLAAALKTPMALMLLALLPTADLRQSVRLVVAAAAVPVAALMPFLVADLRDVVGALTYNGAVGIGGLGLLVQPELARERITGSPVELSPASLRLEDVAPLLTLAALACVAALLRARRVAPLAAATILWLAVYVTGINFAFQYLVWGLPFFLMAGALRSVAATQAVAGFAALLLYTAGTADAVFVAYLAAMTALLAAAAVALAARLTQTAGSRAGGRVVR